MTAVSVTLAPDDSQTVAIGVAAAASSAFGNHTQDLRVHATVDCWLAFGVAPVAVADGTNVFLPAGQTEYFRVGGGHKVSVIRASSDGSLYVTEMTR